MLWSTIVGSENTKQYVQDFPSSSRKPVSSAVTSDGSFLIAAYTRKNVLFTHSTSPLPRVLASQDTDHDKTWTASVCSTKLRALAATFEGLRCLEVSLSTCEPDPSFGSFFFRSEMTSVSQKAYTELGQAPTIQAGPRHRPPAAFKLGS